MKKTLSEVFTIVRFPDFDGYWWMNDPHRHGWEPVRAKTLSSGERIVFRTGVNIAEEIQTQCVEWVKLDEPNGFFGGRGMKRKDVAVNALVGNSNLLVKCACGCQPEEIRSRHDAVTWIERPRCGRRNKLLPVVGTF
jgi:hypothetical protein